MDTARRPVGLRVARPVYKIAQEIHRLWSPIGHSAVPFVDAMLLMERVHNNVDGVPGRAVIEGFLHHAQDWRGPDASRIKAELKGKL